MMTCSFPPEILDQIVDHLYNEPATLGACCLVSKSWVPRARVHLFARVNLNTRTFPIGSWMKVFPDPSNSPAHYARTLTIHGHQLINAAGTDTGRWIRAFRNVVNLYITTYGLGGDKFSLVPLHGLSPTVRSLCLDLTRTQPSEVVGLMCSFPLLEDLTLLIYNYGYGIDRWTAPSTSPRLTGSLELRNVVGGIGPIIRRLLDIPNGCNFAKIMLSCVDETDFKSATDLVSRCSHTLESLEVTAYPPDPPTATPFDLSTATKLKHLKFHCPRSDVRWVTTTLQTVESKNLERIILHDADIFTHTFTEPVCQQWKDLDWLLVQLWTSHSIRPIVTYEVGMVRDVRHHAPSLLPELSRRGLVDFVEHTH